MYLTSPIDSDPRPNRWFNFFEANGYDVSVIQLEKKAKQISKLRKIFFFLEIIIGFEYKYRLKELLGFGMNANPTQEIHDKKTVHIVEDPKILPYLDEKILNKVICDLREFHPKSGQGIKFLLFNKPIYNLIYKKYLTKTRKIVTVNNFTQMQLKRKYSLNSTVLYSVPFRFEFSRDFVPREPYKFVYLGLANKSREIEFMCKVFSKIQKRSLDLFLSGEEKFINKIEKKYSIFQNIRVHSMPELNMVTSTLSNYDVGIAVYFRPLNARYALPNKFFQYIQAQMMIVGYKKSEIGEIIERNRIGITLSRKNLKEFRLKIQNLDLSEIITFQMNSAEMAKLMCQENSMNEIREVFLR